MEAKELIVSHIREYIKADNEVTRLAAQLKQQRAQRKVLTEKLVETMKSSQIDCFDINDGALFYKASKVKKAITGKHLLKTLQQYYESDPTQAEDLNKFIMDHREEQVKETIRRRIDLSSTTVVDGTP